MESPGQVSLACPNVPSAPGSGSVPDVTFHVTQRDDLVVVTTPDEIDIGNAWQLREALLSAAVTGSPAVIVDMSGTEFCDSTGLNVLVRAQQGGPPKTAVSCGSSSAGQRCCGS